MSELMLQKLAEQFGLALDFSKENVIPYLQQLAERVVKYEVGQSIFWMVIGSILVTLGVICIMIFIRKLNDWDEDALIPLFLFGIFFIVFGVPIICCQINDLILCEYLPEKILLRYANISN